LLTESWVALTLGFDLIHPESRSPWLPHLLPPSHLVPLVELDLELRDVRAGLTALETGPEAMGARDSGTDDR
jgi:hypothetical protein